MHVSFAASFKFSLMSAGGGHSRRIMIISQRDRETPELSHLAYVATQLVHKLSLRRRGAHVCCTDYEGQDHMGKVKASYYDCSFTIVIKSWRACSCFYSPQIGIIGGTGLDDPDIISNRVEKQVYTPYGKVSVNFCFV